MHIDPSSATRKDTAESAKAAIATACQQARAEGRLLEGRHNEAQEAQLWREEDCQGTTEYRKGHHSVHSW